VADWTTLLTATIVLATLRETGALIRAVVALRAVRAATHRPARSDVLLVRMRVDSRGAFVTTTTAPGPVLPLTPDGT